MAGEAMRLGREADNGRAPAGRSLGTAPSPGAEPQRRTIRSRSPLLLRDAATGEAPEVDLAVELHMPRVDGGGPVPGVVVVEGLGGLHDARERAYGRKLADAGYAAIIVDSFGSRGVGRNGDLVRALFVTESMMLADAFAALRYLAALPQVDAGRIGVIGFSYGGMISALSAYSQIADVFAGPGPRFATHLSYYGCSIPRMEDPTTTGAPVAVLVGEYDRNVSVQRSDAIVGDLRHGGSDCRFHVFEATYHQWDGPDLRKRFVPANLKRLRLRVGTDNRVRDERTGIAFSGRKSRAAVIGLWTDPTGYSMLHDSEVSRRTDDILFSRLEAM